MVELARRACGAREGRRGRRPCGRRRCGGLRRIHGGRAPGGCGGTGSGGGACAGGGCRSAPACNSVSRCGPGRCAGKCRSRRGRPACGAHGGRRAVAAGRAGRSRAGPIRCRSAPGSSSARRGPAPPPPQPAAEAEMVTAALPARPAPMEAPTGGSAFAWPDKAVHCPRDWIIGALPSAPGSPVMDCEAATSSTAAAPADQSAFDAAAARRAGEFAGADSSLRSRNRGPTRPPASCAPPRAAACRRRPIAAASTPTTATTLRSSRSGTAARRLLCQPPSAVWGGCNPRSRCHGDRGVGACAATALSLARVSASSLVTTGQAARARARSGGAGPMSCEHDRRVEKRRKHPSKCKDTLASPVAHYLNNCIMEMPPRAPAGAQGTCHPPWIRLRIGSTDRRVHCRTRPAGRAVLPGDPSLPRRRSMPPNTLILPRPLSPSTRLPGANSRLRHSSSPSFLGRASSRQFKTRGVPLMELASALHRNAPAILAPSILAASRGCSLKLGVIQDGAPQVSRHPRKRLEVPRIEAMHLEAPPRQGSHLEAQPHRRRRPGEGPYKTTSLEGRRLRTMRPGEGRRQNTRPEVRHPPEMRPVGWRRRKTHS